jgi:tRNA A-37 threonylcarbamoyl transferase component Bud32
MSEAVDRGLSPGAVIDGYRIERRLGQGGVGTVYAAEETTIKRRVAIKVLRGLYAEDPAMIARFTREARAVNEIRHPGIIDVFAIGQLGDGRPYLVMSLLEGRSLRDEIHAKERLPADEAWRVARDVASALSAVHEAEVIHRDLKPDNVFLENVEGGPKRVRVLDFGIAKVAPTEGEMKLTATGAPLGTPAYMAPEQWWGTAVTAATDQYALGVVLFEMLTGRAPFASESFAEAVQQHVHAKPPSLASLGVAVTGAVQAFVERMLEKDPSDRFPSMSAVIEAGDIAFKQSESLSILSDDAEAAPAGAKATTPIAPRTLPALRAANRFRTLHVAIVALGVATLIAVGYAGYARHDLWEWVRIGGWGQLVIVGWFVIATILLVPVARRRATTGAPSLAGFWIALVPALQGAFTTYTGWHAIHRSLAGAGALARFTMFSEGTYEANAGRFLGFAVSSIFCLSLVALPGVSGMANATATLPRAPGVRPREASMAAIALAVIAIVAAVVGAPSAALVSITAAAALGIGIALPTVHAETAARDELERAIAGVLAVALAAAVGITRIEAREGVVWAAPLTRAERVAEIVAASGERATTLPIATVSILVVIAIEGLRIRRLAKLGAIARPRTGTAILAIVLALGAIGDLVQHGRYFGKREELRTDLTSQFALFARLDPPAGDALDPKRFPPHKATALQITRDVIAVDGRGVARLAALTSAEGEAQVIADLNHALAGAALSAGEIGSVDLSISIDRQVPGATVARVLRVARRAGVRRLELLLTRGVAPKLTKGPAEIGVVLPNDFVALPIELGDDGVRLDDAGDFGHIAPALVAKVLGEGRPARVLAR